MRVRSENSFWFSKFKKSLLECGVAGSIATLTSYCCIKLTLKVSLTVMFAFCSTTLGFWFAYDCLRLLSLL